MTSIRSAPTDVIRRRAVPLVGRRSDYDRLLDTVGDASVVLLGEATHGTHEFYRERAVITRRLIAERDFAAVAVEADWPAASRVNRYVHGDTDDTTARDALADFRGFPAWMWRNTAVVDFVGWLRGWNESRPGDEHVGFFGLDLYSLRESMEAVVAYLDGVDPDAARRARARYACFDHFGHDPQEYGYAAGLGLDPSCEDDVVGQLVELRQRAVEYTSRDGRIATEAFFQAEQNARLVASAERYYRSMFDGHVESWNLRDRHMADTLDGLTAFLSRAGRPPKIVVWAHNSHLGDARATEMSTRGELNVGQLVRERHGAAAVLVGFSTFAGTVSAASDWGAVVERKRVRPALRESWEAMLHAAAIPRFLLAWRDDAQLAAALADSRLERAIGVIYRPATERLSHYFQASLAWQFDALVHVDVTRAVEPLERSADWEHGELPDTYPHAV